MRACIAKPLLFLRAVPSGGTAASASLPGYRRTGAVRVARTPLPPAALAVPISQGARELSRSTSEVPQNRLQDAAISEVGDLVRGVESDLGIELDQPGALTPGADPDTAGGAVLEVADVDQLLPGEAEAL